MQFLYADGTDAHFMDDGVLRADRDPRGRGRGAAAVDQAQRDVDLLFIDDQPARHPARRLGRARGHPHRAGLRGDTASGGGNKPATLETGATVSVPLFVNIGDRVKVDTRSGDYMSPCAGRRASADQRRAPSSRSTSTISPAAARRRLRARRRRLHARARARDRRQREELDAASSATRRAGRSTASRRSRRAILRTALLEMLHPDLVEGDDPIPPEGAIDEAVETAKAFCGAGRTGLRQRHPRRSARARCARMARSHD